MKKTNLLKKISASKRKSRVEKNKKIIFIHGSELREIENRLALEMEDVYHEVAEKEAASWREANKLVLGSAPNFIR